MAKAKKAPTQAEIDKQANLNSLDMIAINTVGNHAPGTAFTAKDKAAYERFLSLGVAKKA